ncbi:hypothetical protein VKT23_010911 [Stygiomarasmius scandens]|uniref:DNA 3'-5' helicase n=1 Tax=Marasmiellus scandens TaxID=2682957 RepID=A0ABR1JBG5_9AGAR
MSESTKPRWKDTVGLETIKHIVACSTNFPNGLYSYQLPLIAKILDRDDVLCITATGDGKSALFAIPIVVLHKYNTNFHLYPSRLPTRPNPIGIVVTPTKGLVHQLGRDFGLSVLSYDSDTVASFKRKRENIILEIVNCERWQLVCLDPEHLTGKDWRTILESSKFLSNLVQSTVDEVHLINEWGRDFRIAFRLIGKFICGRLPSNASVVGLTATLLPGDPTSSICKSLGFFRGHFTLIHCSNERSNMQLSIVTASTGFSSNTFPDLLPYLNQNHKTVISYVNPFARIRPYHALLPTDYNQETIQLMETDPDLMVIVSTVALSFGINISTVIDNLGIDFPTTVETWVQEKGRAGRNRNTVAHGITFVTKQTITAAKKVLENPPINQSQSTSISRCIGVRHHNNGGGMDFHRAQLIATENCISAQQNTIFQNPPLPFSQFDCVNAGQPIFCGRCCDRTGVSYHFPPSP